MEKKNLEQIKGESKIITDKNDNPIVNVHNVVCMLKTAPVFQKLIKFDKWTQKLYFFEDGEWVDFRDHHYIGIQCLFQERVATFRKIPIGTIQDAISLYAQEHAIDSAINYVRNIAWDKKDRLATFMHKAYGCPDDKYHKVVGENFLKGMVARIVRGGVKLDTVLVIEGAQGIGKSTSLGFLAGNLGHLETTENPDSKDFLMAMRGKLIVEFTEGVIMSKKDASSLKGFVSKQVDTYRAPYGRIESDHPRRNIFAMTTNNSEYLKDDTGNRRFIPVVALKIDNEYIKEHRDQIFAEALHRYEVLKETFFEYPKKELQAMHKEKIIKSPYYDKIKDWTNEPEGESLPTEIDNNGGFTLLDIWQYCLHGQITMFHIGKKMELAGTLQELGFEKKRNMVNGTQKTRWYRVEKQQNIDDKIDEDLANVKF